MKRNHTSKSLIGFATMSLLVMPTAQAAHVGHWAFDEGSGATAADLSAGVGNVVSAVAGSLVISEMMYPSEDGNDGSLTKKRA